MIPLLKRILSWRWSPYIGAVLVVLIVGAKACNLMDSYSELKGEYNAYRVGAEASAKARAERIETLSDVVKAQSVVIAERDATIAAKQGQVVSGNKKLADLEAEYATLGQDKDAKIVNLLSQVETLKANLTLAYGIIADKDAQLTAWAGKFDAQVKLTDEWVRAYNDERKLRTLAEGLVSKAETKLRIERFKFKGAGLLFTAAAAYVAYDALKGK